MEPLIDPVTLINLILCIVIVILSIIGYVKIRSATPLFIGAAFFLFGVSHAATLFDLKTALDLELIVVRTLGYIAVCIGLFLIIRDILLRMKTTDELKTAQEGLERRVEERTEEIKRANDLLRQSEARFQIAMVQLPGTLWVVDTNLVFTLSQGHGLSSIGLQPDQVVGTSLYEFFGTDDPGHAAIAAHLKVLTGESVTYDYEHKGKTFQTYLTPMYASGGHVNGVIGLAFDITDRKQAEERIRWLASFPELNPTPVIEMDAQGTITFANPATQKALRDLGLPENPALFVPEDKEDILRLLRETGESQVYREITLKNETFAEDITLNHELHVVRIYTHDITERKNREKEIENLKKQTEFILGATRTGLDIIDSQFNLRYIDPMWQKVYGNPAGRKCHEYFMDRDMPCPGCGIQKALETKSISVSEERLPKEGNRPIQVTTIPFQGEDGDWLVAEVNVDITERKQVEAAIRVSEEKYRLIADNTADSIWIFDMDMHLQYISPSVEKMKGFTVEETLSLSLDDMMTPESLQSLMKRFHQEMELEALGTADPHRTISFETEEYCKSGATILIENSVTLLRDTRGCPVGMLGISRDITGRKRAEETIRHALAEKEVLLREIHHRVKNNLAGIISLINLQTATLTDPAAISQLGDLETRIRSMALVHESLYLIKRSCTGQYRSLHGKPDPAPLPGV
jgi:PAS domain S-box-containing protein